MRFQIRQIEPGTTAIAIVGNLVWGRREPELLESAVKNLLDHGQKKFVFDLAELNYADSSGVGVLISC